MVCLTVALSLCVSETACPLYRLKREFGQWKSEIFQISSKNAQNFLKEYKSARYAKKGTKSFPGKVTKWKTW
jgi:hypothetical protein